CCSCQASAAAELYPLPLHDALPISPREFGHRIVVDDVECIETEVEPVTVDVPPRQLCTSTQPACVDRAVEWNAEVDVPRGRIELDRKSTRLNSSHVKTSYAVFCLKK